MKKFFTRLTKQQSEIAEKESRLVADKAELERLESLARQRDLLLASVASAETNFNNFISALRRRADEPFSPHAFIRASLSGAKQDILVGTAITPKFLLENFQKLEVAAREIMLEPAEKALRDFEKANRADLEKLPEAEAGEPPMPKPKEIPGTTQGNRWIMGATQI